MSGFFCWAVALSPLAVELEITITHGPPSSSIATDRSVRALSVQARYEPICCEVDVANSPRAEEVCSLSAETGQA